MAARLVYADMWYIKRSVWAVSVLCVFVSPCLCVCVSVSVSLSLCSVCVAGGEVPTSGGEYYWHELVLSEDPFVRLRLDETTAEMWTVTILKLVIATARYTCM